MNPFATHSKKQRTSRWIMIPIGILGLLLVVVGAWLALPYFTEMPKPRIIAEEPVRKAAGMVPGRPVVGATLVTIGALLLGLAIVTLLSWHFAERQLAQTEPRQRDRELVVWGFVLGGTALMVLFHLSSFADELHVAPQQRVAQGWNPHFAQPDRAQARIVPPVLLGWGGLAGVSAARVIFLALLRDPSAREVSGSEAAAANAPTRGAQHPAGMQSPPGATPPTENPNSQGDDRSATSRGR
jgi:hypothetical protein